MLAVVIIVVAIFLLLAVLGRQKGPASLLSNPGFETGSGTPDGWRQGRAVGGVEYIGAREVAHSGSASLCLKKTAQRYWPIAEWYQKVSHKGGASRLRVSAWVKADHAYKAILDVQYPGGHEWAAYIGAREDGDPPADHDWQEYSGTVSIPPDAAEFTIALQIYGPGTVWFDDVEAAYVD